MKKIFILLSILFSLSCAGVLAQEPASDSVRQKVQEKIQEAMTNPKAYIGSITDITDSTIQIKNKDGDIQQISVNSDTTYVDLRDKPESIEFTEVAIGDYVAAMGFVNGNNVLESSRVLVTTQLAPDDNQSLVIEATDISGNELLGNQVASDEEVSLVINKNTIVTDSDGKKTDSDEIEEGSKLIVIASNIDGKFTASAIRIISTPSATPTQTTDDE